MQESWTTGLAYEQFMGRWSRLIASTFLDWLALPPHRHWLELGCGTGALTETILAQALPASLLAVDPSADFIAFDKEKFSDARVTFQVGNALTLPPITTPLDTAVCGLVLNFIPDPVAALKAIRRLLPPGGLLAFYVWDYAGKMEMLRYFWDSVVALDPDARSLDEGVRFAMCTPDALRQICQQAGFQQIELEGIEAITAFRHFDDFWSPFLLGQGPAPGYVMQLELAKRQTLADHLRASLPIHKDGSLQLTARAWAVRATV